MLFIFIQGARMDDDEQPGRQIVSKIAFLFLILLLPFIPLILSFFEHFVLGTSQVERLCRDLGIHDELSLIYEPIIRLIK